MRRFVRKLFPICAAISLVLFLIAMAMWVHTDASRRTESIVWGKAGVYHLIEFSGDDAEYYVLRDPGFGETPLRWHARVSGWVTPPKPSKPGTLPPGAITWAMPSPASLMNGVLITEDRAVAGSQRSIAATSYGGIKSLGFEHVTFNGWYGPGTSLTSYRFSYFLVILPAAVLPVIWLVRFGVRRWKRGRFGPGRCRGCGYDLRASPERCPECGIAATSESSPGGAKECSPAAQAPGSRSYGANQ